MQYTVFIHWRGEASVAIEAPNQSDAERQTRELVNQKDPRTYPKDNIYGITFDIIEEPKVNHQTLTVPT